MEIVSSYNCEYEQHDFDRNYVVGICQKWEVGNEYLFTVAGVKKMKWFLSLMRCHFQPRVTEGHEWLEMAPSVKLKPLNCLHQPGEVNNELFFISSFSLQLRKPCQNEEKYIFLKKKFTEEFLRSNSM